MTNYDRQVQQQREQYQRDVKTEAKNQKIKKEAKTINQTKRQRIQESASNYGTLTNALLNGSLVKWMFVMFLLMGTIAYFELNSEMHWLDITNFESGVQEIEIKSNAYELDVENYNILGNRIIDNFTGITFIFDEASQVLRSMSYLIESTGSFFGGDNWFGEGVRFARDLFSPLFIWNWEIWGD
jgi:hypothetical protein